jgi:hypothetical protein
MTTYSGQGIDLPMTACGDLSNYQYYFVRPSTSGVDKRVTVADCASAPAPLGVLQNDPKSLEEATVRVLGSTLVYADAGTTAIGYGDYITSGSTGMAMVTTASAYHGLALEALATGCAVLIEVLLMPYHCNTVDNVP